MGTVIDLFAGCGGLSQGLELAGFETVFVNELHPDAMETFLLNHEDSDLRNPKNHAFDILKLSRKPAELEALVRRLNREHGNIDLVVGGPPCQGFSGIGHRRSFDITKEDIPTNHLYREMAKVVKAVAPKAFVFENVRGLLTARWTPDGEKGEIWADVRKTFEKIEVKVGRSMHKYNIGWQLVYAKEYGVPQNRPRIIMVGLRDDISFKRNSKLPGDGLLPVGKGGAPDPIDLLSDLEDPKWTSGGETLFYPKAARTEIQRELRLDPKTGLVLPKGAPLTEHLYSKHSDHVILKFQHMIASGGEIPEAMKTKKFAQRLLPEHWGEGGPSITATSLPDDYVHYSQPRVLTVREWARLQTFPDSYQFFGKRTTGGRRRAGDPDSGDWTRDLPKYTQIGNAVPVKLAEALGKHLKKLIG